MIGITKRDHGGDQRVAKALAELDIHYEIDPDGDFKFGVALEDGRTQIGFIRSRTYEYAGIEMREVLSAGLNSFGPFDARTMNLLLEQNGQVKIGAWSVVRDKSDNHLALFSAKVAADLQNDFLLGVIIAVISTADEMEKRLSGRDDF